jgi:hypothetical protein
MFELLLGKSVATTILNCLYQVVPESLKGQACPNIISLEPGLQYQECKLDQVEIRGVGRQEVYNIAFSFNYTYDNLVDVYRVIIYYYNTRSIGLSTKSWQQYRVQPIEEVRYFKIALFNPSI